MGPSRPIPYLPRQVRASCARALRFLRNRAPKPGTPSPVIRATTTILAGLIASACSSLPGLDFPELTVKPQYYLAKLRGKTRMQSAPAGQPLQNNAAMDLKTVGMRKRDDDYGGLLAYGDGFSGLEFSYARFEIDTSDRGRTTADWGVIPAGSIVESKFDIEEFKLSYIGQVWEHETENETRLQFGLGGTLAHREGKFVLKEDGGGLSQIARFQDDGIPYAAARLRGSAQGFALTMDYAWTNLTFGGDFDGQMQDYALTGSYTLEDQDITFFAGFRWLELPTSGTGEGGFAYDNDYRLEGWVLGAELRF